MTEVQLFWSFRSPYSYLAMPRLRELVAAYALDVRVRIVYPLAIRSPEHFDRVHPLWYNYLLLDTSRIASMQRIPFLWPNPDPVVVDEAPKKFSASQPYIYRLSHLGVESERRGFGFPFIYEISKVIWSGQYTNWSEGTYLADAASRADLSLEELDSEISKSSSTHALEVAENQRMLEMFGHWGVPTLVFKGEPFFGHDRIDQCVTRMIESGLTERSPNSQTLRYP